MAALSSFRYLFIAFIIISSAQTLPSNATPELENEKPFNYGAQDNKGPLNWGTIKPEWETCKTGKLQSPIDMNNKRVTLLPNLMALKKAYKPALATLINRGHTISVAWKGDAGGVTINGTFYRADTIHWHFPSEHTVNGAGYALEGHIIHKSADSSLAVTGVLYQLGKANPFLKKVLSKGKITQEGIDIGIVKPDEIDFNKQQYYRYIGSLTTPPCTEGVIWTLAKKVETVSIEQLNALKKAVDGGYEINARPLQEDN